jgi:hypothetical protein
MSHKLPDKVRRQLLFLAFSVFFQRSQSHPRLSGPRGKQLRIHLHTLLWSGVCFQLSLCKCIALACMVHVRRSSGNIRKENSKDRPAAVAETSARHGFCLLFRLNAFDDSQIPLDPAANACVNLRTVNYMRILFGRD